MNDEINLWRTLTYHDPARSSTPPTTLEHQLADVTMDERVRRLRTPGLKTYREARDAALFVLGMGLGKAVTMLYAPFERSDYDFVATWVEDGTQHFAPVQLKELVPPDLNPRASLQALLGSLSDERPKSSTVLAIKLNRRDRIDLQGLVIPRVSYSQLWMFWASSPDAVNWYLYGDALATPGYFAYQYPT